MEIQPMICVADVGASSRWYQAVLGLVSGHGGDEYEQLLDAGGRLVLQLHDWDVHEHALLGDEAERHGNGVALWFETAEFDAVTALIDAAGATIADGPLFNPRAQHREIWLHDPDGYLVVVSSPFGDVVKPS